MGDEIPERLLAYLRRDGFTLFPGEMNCHTPEHQWVDIAGSKDCSLWAFEYKSKTDSISRGLSQCIAYSRAFDYVVLVSEGKRPTRSRLFGEFRKKGFGLWTLHRSCIHRLTEPRVQKPEKPYRERTKTQFLRSTGVESSKLIGPLMRLDSFTLG